MDKKITPVDIAYYIIENKATVMETALHFNISKSTVQKNIQKLKASEDQTIINLYEELRKTQSEIQKEKNIIGGQTGKRKTTLSQEQIEMYAERFIEDTHTLRSLEKEYGITKSTIYENFYKKLPDDLLKRVKEKLKDNADAAKRNNYGIKRNKGVSFNEVGEEIYQIERNDSNKRK